MSTPSLAEFQSRILGRPWTPSHTQSPGRDWRCPLCQSSNLTLDVLDFDNRTRTHTVRLRHPAACWRVAHALPAIAVDASLNILERETAVEEFSHPDFQVQLNVGANIPETTVERELIGYLTHHIERVAYTMARPVNSPPRRNFIEAPRASEPRSLPTIVGIASSQVNGRRVYSFHVDVSAPYVTSLRANVYKRGGTVTLNGDACVITEVFERDLDFGNRRFDCLAAPLAEAMVFDAPKVAGEPVLPKVVVPVATNVRRVRL